MKFKKMIAVIAIMLMTIAALATFAACTGGGNDDGNDDDVNVAVSIEVTTKPKTQYYLNEAIDITGGKITVTFSKDPAQTVDIAASNGSPAEGISISGFDSSTAGEKTITVGYLELEATYNVTVLEHTASVSAVLVLVGDLPRISWVNENEFSNEEVAAAAQAFSLYNALTAAEKAVVGQREEAIVSAAFGVEYMAFKATLPQQALDAYRSGCTAAEAGELHSALSAAPATATFFDKYSAYSTFVLYNNSSKPVTIGNLKNSSLDLLAEMSAAKMVLGNAIALFAGYSDLPAELPLGDEYLTYTGITSAFNVLKTMDTTSIQEVLPLLLSWQEHYIEIMYEYCYYKNSLGFEDIETLFVKLPLIIFKNYITVAGVVSTSFDAMINRGEYVMFYASFDRLADIVFELYDTYSGSFNSVIAVYEQYAVGGTTMMQTTEEYFDMIDPYLYFMLDEMRENDKFTDFLRSYFSIVEGNYFDEGYLPGAPSFNADFSELLTEFKTLSLYEQYYFYMVEEGFYTDFLREYYQGILSDDEYNVFRRLMLASLDYMEYQFGNVNGQEAPESTFLTNMEDVIYYYEHLSNKTTFNLYFGAEYLDYYNKYQIIIETPEEIKNLFPLLEEVYFGDRCATEMSDYARFFLYYPQLAAAVDSILNSGNAELISAYNSYIYKGDDLKLAVLLFGDAYNIAISKIQKYPSVENFMGAYLEICAKWFSIYNNISFTADDTTEYEGDFNAEMGNLMTMFFALSLEERAVIITTTDIVFKIMIDGYYGKLLSGVEFKISEDGAETDTTSEDDDDVWVSDIMVYDHFVMAWFFYSIYLDPNGRFSDELHEYGLRGFQSDMAACIEIYGLLPDKQAFDACFLSEYLAFVALYEFSLLPDIFYEWTYTIAALSDLEVILTVYKDGMATISYAGGLETDIYSYEYQGDDVFKFTFSGSGQPNFLGAVAYISLSDGQLRWFDSEERLFSLLLEDIAPYILGTWTYIGNGSEIILTVYNNGTATASDVAGLTTDTYGYEYQGDGVFKFTFSSLGEAGLLGAEAYITRAGTQLKWSDDDEYLFTKAITAEDLLGVWKATIGSRVTTLTVYNDGTATVSAVYGVLITDTYNYEYQGNGVFKFTYSGEGNVNLLDGVANVTVVDGQIEWHNYQTYTFTKVE